MLVETEVCDELLELAILVLELLHPPQLAHAKAAIDLFSAVVCPLQDAHPADHLRHRRARLRLPQRIGNLLLGVP